jgi:prepilin signal peptidase PulO-like enzyme (type II secretory pathway)
MFDAQGNPFSSVTTFNVFAGAIALLAFVMAFYGLVARERKTPYITNSLYSLAFIFLLVLFFTAVGQVATAESNFRIACSTVAGLLLIIGIVHMIFVVRRVQNVHSNLRDDHTFKNLQIVRWTRSKWRSLTNKPRYEYNPAGSSDWSGVLDDNDFPFHQRLVEARERALVLNNTALSLSMGVRAVSFGTVDPILVKIALKFLRQNLFVQYTACSRHPIEFVKQVKIAWEKLSNVKSWNEVCKQIVVIDAYSPHFGFTDTIHEEASRFLEKQGVVCIKSPPSYAGVHTAAATAFNVLKEREKSNPVRTPTLVVYDCLHALADLESREQYRVFIRHLIPSERQYGGMFTVALESGITDEDWDLLRAYVDVSIDPDMPEMSNDKRNGDLEN